MPLSRWLLGLWVIFGASAASAAPLSVIGTPTPLALTLADLAAMQRAQAVLAVHGSSVTCDGVWLADVLAKAGVPAGDAVKGPALTQVVVAEARDGYRVVFSLGEIERSLGNGRVLVADTCNGKPLAAEDGPVRIVAAGEKRGARSVRGLERLVLVPVGDMKSGAKR